MPTLRTRSAKGSELSIAELDANFKRPVSQKTASYTCVVGDNRSLIECNHATTAFTITLGDAATMAGAETGDYEVTISNIGIAEVTVSPSGTDTINGTTNSISLIKDSSVTLKVNSTANGYVSISSVNTFGRKNAIINGNFDIWQRGTSQTTTEYGSDDRWINNNSGSTKTHSQQSFTVGQTAVPGNPKYYSRTVVTSVAGTNNYVVKEQRIEDVRSYAGETVTISFYAKADATKNIAIELYQDYGTGGSPSSPISGIGAQKISLTTSWQKYTATISIPSISGKTLGTNNDHFLALLFWFDAGSNYDARTDSLGQQSGTFDIAQVQLEPGTVATPFERRSIGEELMLCQRFYQYFSIGGERVPGMTSNYSRRSVTYLTQMRAGPTITVKDLAGNIGKLSYNTGGSDTNNATYYDVGADNNTCSIFFSSSSTLPEGANYLGTIYLDAEL